MRFLFAALLSAHILSAGAVSAADSLVAYWALDDSAGTALDNSTYGNDGVLQGGAAWEPGIAGNALRCSGTGDYVDCGTDASFDFTKAFTLSAWFKTSMEASAGLICKSANNGNNCSYRLHKTEGNDVVQFSVSADGSPWAAYIYSTTVVKDGEWHHAVGVYDGTAGRMELYLDGVKEGAIVGAVPESLYQNDLNVEVGRTNEYYCMDGLIDEVKMFNVALDEAEITGLYREFSHPDAVYWSFDEGSGSVAGSADDADYPFEIFNASWNSEGVSGSCLEFNYQNGYGDYAEVRDTSFAACEERFSFSMWVYPYTSPSGTQKEHILEKCYRNDNDTRGYQVSLLYGQFHFSTSQPDGQWENGGAMAFGPTINAGQWYHLAFTWDKDVDGGALYGYVDGVRYHIYTKTTTQYVQNLPLLIGRYVEKPEQSDYCFNGRLDEIRYYGRALDSAGVAGLYHEFDASGGPLFADVTSMAGVAGRLSGDCHGAYWGDMDNDGDLDLISAGYGGNTALFVNNGDGTFSDATVAAGIDADASSGVVGDYDNDGDLDYYSSGAGYPDKLYRNNGDGTFTDVASAAGLADKDGYGVAFFDYDLDGDLDLYLACNPPGDKTGAANVLYRNDGDGTFTDVTAAAGVGNTGSGMGVTCADLNGDRYPEIYVANNFNQANVLYRNNGDGTFTDIALTSEVADAWDTKCGIFGDYDNDGDLDLAVTNEDHGDLLYRNEGNFVFTDVSSAAGITGPGRTEGGSFSDFDNDGDLDLYLTGYAGYSNVLYRNNGDGTFSDITDSAGVGLTGYMLGCAAGDYDDDGYIDIYAVRAHDEGNVLYHNEGYGANWIGIDLEGTENNRFGIGSEVRVYAGGICQVRQVQTTTGMYSQDGRCGHFGLGTMSAVDSVEVIWPNGAVTMTNTLATGTVHILGEPVDAVDTELVLTLNSARGTDGCVDMTASLAGPADASVYRVDYFAYRFADSAVWNHIDPDSLIGNGLQQPGDVALSWAAGSEVAPHAGESLLVSFKMASGSGTGVWGAIADKPTQRYQLSAAVLGGRIYAAGGSASSSTDNADMHIYDPGTGTWSDGVPMPEGRRLTGSGVVDGKWLLVGGYYDGSMQSSLYIYDPVAGSWSTGASMAVARCNPNCGVINGKFYVAGGALPDNGHTAVLEIYDPETDSWSTGASMPEERRNADAAVWDGKLYVFGGNNGAQNDNFLSSVVVYDPASDSWTYASDMPKTLACHEVLQKDGLFYLIGGHCPVLEPFQDSVFTYNPVRAEWHSIARLQVPRRYFSSCILDDKIYALCGYNDSGYLSRVETLAVSGRASNYVTGGPIAVNDINMAPVITSGPVIDAVAGLPWVYYVTASDQDSNDLVFAVESAPAGMTVDSDAGILQWVPEDTDTGTVTVTVSVSDGHGGSDSQTFDLTVHAAADSSESDITGPGHCFCGGTGARLTVVTMGGSGKIKVIVHCDSFPPYLPGSGKPVKRTYQIEADSTLTGLEVELTLAYLQEEFNASGINNEKSLYAARYHNGKWEQLPSTVDTLANTVTCNTDGFSIWAIGGDGGPLPVSLSSLTAQTGDEGVILRWTTESETGNLGWNVQRRTAAAPGFDQVNGPLIPGAGTTVEPQTYSYIDAVHAGGAYLYRLEQIDINGTKSYSDEVDVSVVTLGIDGPQLITGSPVRYGIRFRNPKAGNVTVRLYSSDGTVRSIPADGYFDRGEHMVPLPATAEAGIYLVRIDTAAGSTTAKLVITR